jgi:hypothetical protein
MTAFGKIEGLTGRLMLVFHLMESPFNTTVCADLVTRCIRIAKEYLIPAFRYALSDLGGMSTFDTWVQEYVIHYADKESLTLSEIKRSGRRQLGKASSFQADQMVINALHTLEKSRWVLRLDDGSKEHQHIATWAINPALKTQFSDYRTEVIQAKQRRLEEIYKLSTKEKPKVKGYQA